MEQWFIAAKRADFNGIAERFHVSPVLARLMRNRDLTTDRADGEISARDAARSL